uniref:Uncharacterized protein n=1 Tax=Meloidogyne incognita TaxID=6306 RepID=A0A914N5V0_MELIC
MPSANVFVCDFEKILRQHQEFKLEIASQRSIISWLQHDNKIMSKRLRELELVVGRE